MTCLLKNDAKDIETNIENIKKQSWLTESQKWWPNYLFHYTDITNAVKILTLGKLLSRFELESNKTFTDIASPDVISTTKDKWKKYVRLYFRPRTPTQYRNEGFRSKNELELGGAHCPIPIYLIFDSKPILTDIRTCFSDGNLGSPFSVVSENSDFLLNLPFESIYHDKSLYGLNESEKSKIIYHRCAEVIMPTFLELTHLKIICCRSQAEYETLINTLPDMVLKKWIKKISVDSKQLLFFSKWTFINKADITSKSIYFKFNPSISPGPFNAILEILEEKTKETYEWKDDAFNTSEIKNSIKFDLSKLKYPESYIVTFYLDEHLTYKKKFSDKMELPF